MEAKLYRRLGISRGITSVIGSGGKTTLIRRLAEELAGEGFTVIVTTTTKIYIPGYCRLYAGEDVAALEKLADESGIVCAGRPFAAEAFSVDKGSGVIRTEAKLRKTPIPFEKLKEAADFVLVEADGSKHLPLKAHLGSEPVIPEGSAKTVLVVGMDGIGGTVRKVAHRAEAFSELSGLGAEETVTVEAVAEVIKIENLSDVVYISQIRSDEDEKAAEMLAQLVEKPCVLGLE